MSTLYNFENSFFSVRHSLFNYNYSHVHFNKSPKDMQVLLILPTVSQPSYNELHRHNYWNVKSPYFDTIVWEVIHAALYYLFIIRKYIMWSRNCHVLIYKRFKLYWIKHQINGCWNRKANRQTRENLFRELRAHASWEIIIRLVAACDH